MASKTILFLFLLLTFMVIFAFGQDKSVKFSYRDTLPIKFDSLKAAIVTATMRPHVKRDTLEYNTEHVQLHPNAVVEELLRRLPGLHIDPDGSITFNGDKIQRLLVDGEDIFGNDPTVVTRNFDANKIARVQILDRKTDHAIFTGMDDGSRAKTLNLVMKESAKNGYFGRAEAGGNPEGYYTAAGALAEFRRKEQLTALVFSGNTGVLGFSNNADGLPAAIRFLYSITDPLGASAGNGIPRVTVTGLHYANRWNGLENHLLTNYQYGHLWTHPITTTRTVQTQPGSIYGQQQQSQSVNQEEQHTIHGFYEWVLSTRSAFQFNFNGDFNQYQNHFDGTTNSSFNDTLVNVSLRTIRDQTRKQTMDGDVSWRIQLGNQFGKVISLTAGLAKAVYTTNGYLYSINKFFQPDGSIRNMDTVNQRKQISDRNLKAHAILTYTQPLFPGADLGLNYGLSISHDNPLQATYARGNGKYDETIDSLTSGLKTRTINHWIMIHIHGKTRHFSYTVGTDWLHHSYRQQDNQTDSILNLHYINWAPRLLLDYAGSPVFNIKFDYNIATQEPLISQLAPIKNNSDPLHLTLGNPNLRSATTQNFSLSLRWLKAWMAELSLNLAVSSNDISTRTLTDSFGHQVSQPVNVDGGRSAGASFFLNRRLGGIDWGFHTTNNYSRTVNYVNADISRNDVYTNGGGLSATRYVPDKYSFQINTNFSYFYSRSSINTSAPLRYWTQFHSAMATVFLIAHFQFGTSATYTWQQKTSTFSTNTSVVLWNAWLSRNFLHDKLVAKALLNNILGQEAGITRTTNANVNIGTSTNILGRYWMLSAIYHFDKKFKKK